jgi:Tol biopolymer transport system component
MKPRLKTVALVLAVVSSWVASAQTCHLERASNSYTGSEANGISEFPSVSHDGRFVAFGTWASNIVPGDANGLIDTVLLDRQTGGIELVSVSSLGVQANGHSTVPKVSADGRIVAFLSTATNLDVRDVDTVQDVYVHDRNQSTTTLVSERLGTGPSQQGCYGISISADGRYVAFDCIDDNVVPGDNNFKPDVFVRDLLTQTTELVSVGPQGQQGDRESFWPSISGDGRFVSFISGANNWFPVGPQWGLGLASGVFIRDRQLSATLPVSNLSTGIMAPTICESPTMSADGRYVAYKTNCRFLTPGVFNYGDILRWDRTTGQTMNACYPSLGLRRQQSFFPVLSADGRYVAFETLATNFTVQRSRPPMVIWRDLETLATVCANDDWQGGPANNWANNAAISGDGRVVAFVSKATDLVPGASGAVYHVYVRACDVASPATYCKPSKPAGGCVAGMTFQGTPSATAGSGFQVRAQGLEAHRVGLLFYGTNGPAGKWLAESYLCVKAPVVHAVVASSQGTTGCDGSLSLDFNSWIASGADPTLVAGQAVCAQAWFRNATGSGQLSDAVAFLIGP